MAVFCLLWQLAPAAATPPPWLPSATGYTSLLKPFWFGANVSGLDSPETLAVLSKHAVAGYGWQTGGGSIPGIAKPGRGEAWQAAAVAHARAYLGAHGNNRTMLFEYRQVQVALGLFAATALIAADPHNEGFWLHDAKTGRRCTTGGSSWGTADYYWDFTNSSAAEAWLDRVIGQLVTDDTLEAGRSAVFFDEVDQGQCGYKGGDCDFVLFNSSRQQAASNALYRRMVSMLNAAGIVPILSLDNRMAASAAGLPRTLAAPCALPEDELVDALEGLSWVRFYENWPRSFWVPDSPDLHAAMVANALLEAKRGIPTVLHAMGDPCWACPQPQRSITRPGRLFGSIEYVVASYLIVQSPGTTLSISNDWYDSDFCWWPEFDVEYGVPLGDAVRTGTHSWYRNYTRCNVAINVSCDRHADCLGTVELLI